MQREVTLNYPRIAFYVFLAAWLCMVVTFPAFPIDETRYLTVAWEMRHSGDWLLPTLNGAPYSHKPPLLFWLIDLAWLITGPAVWPARFIAFCTAVLVLTLTGRLARTVFPERPAIGETAPLLLLSIPLFMVYGNMIMFDFLLCACALAALIALWKAAHEREAKWWIYFGLSMGAGVLAKGPVILVHTMGPALLAPFLWLPKNSGYSKAGWYGRILGAILIATAVGLAWAVPASIIGGPKFAHMIFWGQTADRMVDSFAHRRPFWFYIQALPLIMLPWLFMRPFWQGLQNFRTLRDQPAVRFILCWIVPAFIAFSLISGKQLHYIVPLFCGLAILAALVFREGLEKNPGKPFFPWFILPYAIGFIVLAAAPYLPFVRHNHDNQFLANGVGHFSAWPFIVALLAGCLITRIARKNFEGQALAMIALPALLLSTLTIEAGKHAYRYYDLEPVAQALKPLQGHPIAWIGKYQGEIGFTARLTQPATEIELKALPAWFEDHPDGIAIRRDDNFKTWPEYKTLYSQPYKGNERFFLLQPLSSP